MGIHGATINGQTLYIKHLNIRDQRHLQSYHEKYKQIAIDRGRRRCRSSVTQQILADGMWTDAEDQKIASLQFEIENLKATIKAVFLPSQQKQIKGTLNERREELDRPFGQTSRKSWVKPLTIMR